jgi:glutamine cyclotransferase
MKNVLIGLLLFGLVSCNQNSSETDTNVTGVPIDQAPATPIIHYDVVNYWPHSTNAFTEGLLFFNNSLYESTGAPQNFPTTLSAIYKTDINTHQSVVQATIDREKYFGEGMAILNNKVYQLTYQNKLGFIYNLANFKPIGQFSYDNAEGWGLTHDSTYLIMSDGTSQLTYLSTQNMKPVKKINVTENGVLVERLNELEYIK